MSADIRAIVPGIIILLIIIIILSTIFRRTRRMTRVRTRNCHNPCATYVLPGCEVIHASPPNYPQPQPMYYQQPNPIPPQQLYPQAAGYPSQIQPMSNPPYPTAPTTSYPNPQASPPPYYSEQPKGI